MGRFREVTQRVKIAGLCGWRDHVTWTDLHRLPGVANDAAGRIEHGLRRPIAARARDRLRITRIDVGEIKQTIASLWRLSVLFVYENNSHGVVGAWPALDFYDAPVVRKP